ncbi:unnamed protein product [Paramecium primaurelia]|uniref:Uncharacterized protein n=1 Tax=Paramecium primaurelia TaxID=5886 RepID=A0A8S1LJW0_PARPR|nr:unnamed protein product [Paramecium primaurelia]
MKPSRPPICSIPNQIIVYDQRLPRPNSTKNAPDTRQVIRYTTYDLYLLSHITKAFNIIYFRASSPTAITRIPHQEHIHVNQFQNLPIDSDPIQHKQATSVEYVPIQQEQQHQKYIEEINQKNQAIIELQEQISELQNKLSEKIQDYTVLKEKFDIEFKKFQEEIQLQIKGIDLNIQLNEYTSYFMQEIDRKVLNLQSNINSQIDEMKVDLESKLKQNEHFSKNLLSNTTIRLNQDEQHFQQELSILQKKLEQKMDKNMAEQIIAQSISNLQQQYQTQLSQAHQIIDKINSDKSDEINKIKIIINNQLLQVNQQAQSQIQQILEMVQDNSQSQQTAKQYSQQLKQQYNSLVSKFSQIQQQYTLKVQQKDEKLQIISKQNEELKKEIQDSQLIIQKQQQELYKISSNNKFQKSPYVQQILSPKNIKSNSFYTNSTSAGLNFTKNRPLSVSKKSKKQHNSNPFEISIEDFANFNENSILDSNQSIELLTQNGKSSLIQSPKNPFKSSQLMNINRFLNENNTKIPFIESTIKKQSENIPPLHQAIKRRLLYLGKQQKTLLCTYSGEQLCDAEMGMQLLDDNGKPFIINEDEKNELIAKQLIQLI